MALGFWKGDMHIRVPRTAYGPGETIKGEVHMKLKKATKARKLTIAFIGKEIVRKHRTDSHGHMHHYDDEHVICDVKVPIGGEKEYKEVTLPFEVTVPPNVLDHTRMPEGVMGGVVQTMEVLSGQSRRTQFYLEANIDIPMGFDLSAKQDIVIR